MTNSIKFFLFVVCVSSATCEWQLAQASPGTPQNSEANAREAIFREASEGFKKADEVSSRLLSPKYYAEAQKSFQKAQEIYDRGGKLADVRSNLSRTMQNLDLAMRTAELCQVALKDVLALRNEVLASGLSFNRSNDFREAEKKLIQAAEKMEKGDLKGTRKPGDQAAERYRKAVLQALEKQVIPDAKKRLNKSKKTYTKEEYKRAEESLKSLEQLVKTQNKKSFSVAELTSKINQGIEQALK